MDYRNSNPLVNDDPYLSNPSPLNNSSPLGLDIGGLTGAPLGLQPPQLQAPQIAPMSNSAFEGRLNSIMAPRPTPAATYHDSTIFYSPSTGNIVVNGSQPFSQENATAALASEQFLNLPRRQFTLPDTADDWQEMSREDYAAYLDTIKNPSYGRRMGEAWDNAWRGMADVGVGAALAVNPDWSWAQEARDNIRQEFENDAPFMMQLRDVQNVGDAATYFSQMLVQGAPWVVETLASMTVGGIVGGLTTGGAGAAFGAVEGLTIKEGIKQATRQVIQNNLRRGALAYERAVAEAGTRAVTREAVTDVAVRNSIASADDVNRFFNFTERGYDAALAARIERGAESGALAGMFGSNYMTGVGDIRNSIADSGADPTTADAVANIWGLALPYALIESVGDILITQPITRIGPEFFNATARSTGFADQLAARGTNMLRGGLVTGTAEGVEEGLQYGITQQGVAGANNRSINIDPIDLMENAVGGAIAGFGLGGATHIFRRPNVRPPEASLATGTTTPTTPTPEGPAPWDIGLFGTPSLPDMGPQGEFIDRAPLSDQPMPWEMGSAGTPGLQPARDPYEISGNPLPREPANVEREYLRTTINDPGATPEQRRAAQQALEALNMRDEVDYEASQRGRDSVGPGGNPEPIQPSLPFTDPAPTDLGPAYQRKTDPNAINTLENEPLVPPGLSTMDRPARSRELSDIWRDLAQDNPVEVREIQALRQAVQQLARQNPTEPGYTDVLSQLDEIESMMRDTAVTDENSDQFRAQYPELTQHLATKEPGFTESPMDAARPPAKAQPIKAKAVKRGGNVPATSDVDNPIMPDGQRKYGPHRLKKSITEQEAQTSNADGLRGRTQETAATSQEPNLIERAKEVAKTEEKETARKANQLKQRALAKRIKEKAAATKFKELAQRKEPPVENKKTGPISDDIKGMTDNAAALHLGNNLDNEDVAEIRALESKSSLNKRQLDTLNALRVIAGYAKLTEAAQPKVEEKKQDAVPERSAEEIPAREQPRVVPETPKRDTARDSAPTESTNEKRTEEVSGTEVNLDDYNVIRMGPRVGDREYEVWDRLGPEFGPDYNAWNGALSNALSKQRDRQDSDPTPRELVTRETLAKHKLTGRDNSQVAIVLWEVKTIKNGAVVIFGKARIVPTNKADAVEKALRATANIKRNAGTTSTKDNTTKEVPGTEVDQKRIDAAYNAGMRHYEDLFKFLQGIRGSMKAPKLGDHTKPMKITERTKWAEVDGRGLNYNELFALEQQAKAKYGADSKGERKAAAFHQYVKEAWAQNKADPKHFATFVEGSAIEVVQWLKFDISNDLPAARKEALAILNKLGNTSQAVQDKQTTVTKILRRVLSENPNFTFTSIHPATRERANEIAKEIQQAQSDNFEEVSTRQNLIDALKNLKRQLAKESTPKQSTGNERVNELDFKPMKKSVVQTIVAGAQQRIWSEYKFRSTHVFADEKDFWNKIDKETMIAENGAKVTIAQYIKRQAALKKLEYGFEQYSEADLMQMYYNLALRGRAVVIRSMDAMLVFAGHMETTREVQEVIEHEYIAHKGLSVFFENEDDQRNFLSRLMSIPGMKEKRLALINAHKAYGRLPLSEQVEEVLAFHAMEGPLAIEKLLSAPQAFDPKTKRSLWEDFKQTVMDWLSRIFTGYRSEADKALDAVVAALRERAMTGNAVDLHKVIDPFATMTKGEVEELAAIINSSDNDTRQAAMNVAANTNTPEETWSVLYDTENDPGRPYTPKPIGKDLYDVLRSNEPMAVKLREAMTRIGGTSVKEALKAIGRELTTMNQMALESVLIEKSMEIMENTIKHARGLMTEMQDARDYAYEEAYDAELRKIWGDKAPGATEEQRKAYGRLAIVATNNKLAKLTDAMVRAAPRLLVRNFDGTYTVNEAVFEELVKQGTFSKEDFLNGIEQFTVDADGEVTSAGKTKLDKDLVEAGYDIYVRETYQMAKSTLNVLKATTTMLSQRNGTAVAEILEQNKFKPEDREFVSEALQRMFKLYSDIAFHDYLSLNVKQRGRQQEKARDVLVELMRSFWVEDKVADWTDLSKKRKEGPRTNDAFKWREQVDPDKDVAPFTTQIAWFLNENRLERINGLGVGKNQQYDMLNIFQSLLNAEVLAHEKENSTIHSILANYVEMTRKGKWRVSLDVLDEKGKPAEITPQVRAMLPVTYVESEREAIQLQHELAEELSNTYTIKNALGEDIKVKFDVAVAMAPGTQTMTEAPKVKEFLQVAELAGLSLNAKQMSAVLNLIENASKRKWFGIQRSASPGMDASIIQNNNQTMTNRAWEAAKIQESWMLQSTLADPKNRYGDWDKLAELQRNFDAAEKSGNGAAIRVTEMELLRYANQLRHMARRSLKRPMVNIRTTKGEKKLKIIPEAEAHINHANALQASLERNELEVNLNDLISKTGALRQMGVVMQLGTIASGIMNAFAPVTHLPAVLTAHHGDTGYGEGFGLGETVANIATSINQVFNPLKGYDDTVRLKEMLDQVEKGNNTTPLDIHELRAMYKETVNGKLTPQQTYSMTGGTESNITQLWYRKVSNALLKPFSSIESSTRRVAFLTTYRLAKQRYIAAGVSEAELNDTASAAYKKLIKDVERVIDHSQGNYVNVNRPRAFRGDWAQYVLQYKMFPLITVLMVNNLPVAQKGLVLATLLGFSGLKGEPFADDFADIYDAVLQKLGFQHDSVELQLTQFFEGILPGSSNWIMHGAIDSLPHGASIGARLGLGDIIPLTGAFREGANVGREVINAFGPAFAANMSAVEYAGLLTDYVLEATGARPRVTPWEDLLRKFPQGQIRSMGDAVLMARDGEIVDPRGRLTSDEVNIMNIFTRALGFYPLEAAKANNAVRLDRMHTEYMRTIRGRFILSYANAYRRGNQEHMDNILDAVRDWNDAAETTGQEDMIIRNFRSAALRAGKASSQTTVERTSQGAPDYSLIDELAEVLNADTEADNE